jgi:molecular chaperone HscB
MNFYTLYGFDPGFVIDKTLLKQRFYQLSRQYHPDFYQPGPGETAGEALQLSAAVNKGYKVFSSQDETVRYLLQVKGLLPEDEKYALPPLFLAEVMDLNEALMEVEMEPDATRLATCASAAQKLMQQLETDVQPWISSYRDGSSPETDLLPVKDYYYKKKYLMRILDKIGELQNTTG